MPLRPYDTTPEQLLLPLIAQGNADAFGQLYLRHYDKLYSFALAYLKIRPIAEDLVHQTFLHLWEKRRQFADVQDAGGYLYTATRNAIYNSLRRQAVEDRYQAFIQELFAEEHNTPEEELILKQKADLMEHIISRLSERQQRAFRLNRQEGLRYEAIAREMNLSVATVKKLMHEALTELRRILRENKEEFMLVLFGYFMR